MTEAPVPTNAPSHWHDVLVRVEDSLEVCLHHAEQREQSLIVADRVSASEFPEAMQQFLDRLDERMRSLKAVVEQADRTAAEIEAGLADREEALRKWSAEFASARDRLAETMQSSV